MKAPRMFPAATTPPRVITLILLTAISVLSLNMFLPSLTHMAEDLGTDYATVSLSIAAYLATTAVLQIIMGPLSDRFGRRPVLLWGLAIFVVASVGCAFAPDFSTFMVFRLLQGAIISAMALSRAVVRDMLPPREAAGMMGYIGMAMAMAPMLGPVVGGMIDITLGWRATFGLFAITGVALFVLCWVDLAETNLHKSATFAQQFRNYPELFRSRRFWGYTVCMAFSVGGFYTFLAGAPLVASNVFGMSTATLGFVMGSITVGYFCGSFIAGRVAADTALTTMMIAGRLVTCAGLCLGIAIILAGWVSPVTVFGASMFVGLGNGLTLPSANAGALSVRPNLAGSASGLSGALTVGFGAVLTAISASVIARYTSGATLLLLLLVPSVIALVAAYYVRMVDRREGDDPALT